MSDKDIITVMGNLAADPERRPTRTGGPVTTFRVASSQRHFDRQREAWVESGTNWYQVSAFRALGEHAFASLRKGERVIVTGRLKLREWEAGEKKGLSVEIEADGVGHDLLWGTTQYTRAHQSDQWAVPGAGHGGAGAAEPAGEGPTGWTTAQPGGGVADDRRDWGAPGADAPGSPDDAVAPESTAVTVADRDLVDSPF